MTENHQPTPAEWLPAWRSRGRRVASASLGALLYWSGIHRLAWRNRALIALFHRVDDRYPTDSLTYSRAQFASFCDFAARYFTVVPLSDLLARMRSGGDISRRLVITFDDGYRDNHRAAAPELRKRGLPACFFVTTGLVGTNQTAWWDAQAGIVSEWMSWDDVRSLRRDGFEIGAHTVTHADCGAIGGDCARREIAGSKEMLEEQLGEPVHHFAFPYGGPLHMTEENRALVRAAGFDCCLSTDRGTVRPGDDPYRLNRIPIDTWYQSPYDFGSVAIRKWVLNGRIAGARLAGMGDRGVAPPAPLSSAASSPAAGKF